MNKKYSADNVKFVESPVDGLKYGIHREHDNHEEAAKRIGDLNSVAADLIQFVKRKYGLVTTPEGVIGGHMMEPRRRKIFANLITRYNPDKLSENSPKNLQGETAYTVNKGDMIAMCLREKGTEVHDFHDQNTLRFVFLHELTHVGTDVRNHPPEFWTAFKIVLEEAVDAGLYYPVNYAHAKTEYCGLKIDYNPYYD